MKSYIQSRKELTGIKAYTPGDSIEFIKEKYKLSSVIKLASNENPLGSAISLDQLSTAFSTSYLYPDSNSHKLLETLGKKHNQQKENLILGNGSDEIFLLLALAYLDKNSEVICPQHTFSVYESVTQLMGASYTKVKMNDYNTDLSEILKAINSNTKLIFIANPNNPTGTFINSLSLSEFLSKVPPDIIVVLDEAYKDYVVSEPLDSNVGLLARYKNVVITRTFSKLYGLAGFRVGYGISSKEIVANLQKVRPPFNVNSLALEAALLALDNTEFVQQSNIINQEGILHYKKACKNWPVTMLQTQANFVCLLLHNHCSQSAYDACIKKGIIIRKLTSFGLDNAIRITIGSADQNKHCINSLTEFFK